MTLPSSLTYIHLCTLERLPPSFCGCSNTVSKLLVTNWIHSNWHELHKKTKVYFLQWHVKTTDRFYVECHFKICSVQWSESVSVQRDFTCLWVEDLRGEVWRWRAGGEVFIAVGDEGRQWVDVVGVLHHWDFIGLWTKEQAQEFMSRKSLTQHSKQEWMQSNPSKLLHVQLKQAFYYPIHVRCTWSLLAIVGREMHGVNRPSRVSALHGKHHSLCVWPALWCNLDQHQGTLKSLADTCQDHYGHLAEERTVCSVQQEKQRCHRVQKSHQQATNKHNQAKVNWIPINKWRHHLPLCLTAVTWWE